MFPNSANQQQHLSCHRDNPTEQDQEEDVRYFLKKMGWSREQLESYLTRPEVPHAAYPTEKPLWDVAVKVYKAFKSK